MTTTDATTICGCGQPTRDHRHTCDTCLDHLTQTLNETPWLDGELETTLTRQKAVTYTGHNARGAETPTPVHWGAANARATYAKALGGWVRYCLEHRVPHSSPHAGPPAGTLTGMSRWLLWRVDGLAVHAPLDVDAIIRPFEQARRVIDRPADLQYLGHCDACPDGRYYAPSGGATATCDTCRDTAEADTIRDHLLAELDDRLCTAAEIASLATYLGLRASREQVRKRINQWHSRGSRGGRLVAEHAFSDEPVFRFGIVWRLLVHEDEKGGA